MDSYQLCLPDLMPVLGWVWIYAQHRGYLIWTPFISQQVFVLKLGPNLAWLARVRIWSHLFSQDHDKIQTRAKIVIIIDTSPFLLGNTDILQFVHGRFTSASLWDCTDWPVITLAWSTHSELYCVRFTSPDSHAVLGFAPLKGFLSQCATSLNHLLVCGYIVRRV